MEFLIGSQPLIKRYGPYFVVGGDNMALIKLKQEIIFAKSTTFMDILYFAADGTFNSKINGTPKDAYLPISKLHSILAIATAKIECSFEMHK